MNLQRMVASVESVVVLVESPVALRGIGGRLRGITGRFHGIAGRSRGFSGRKIVELMVGFSGLGGRISVDYAESIDSRILLGSGVGGGIARGCKELGMVRKHAVHI
jgi:hypothetical protein